MAKEIALPFGVDATGGIGQITDGGQIHQNHVFSAVGTNKGERVMNPDYGTRLIEHLFAAVTDNELETLEADIADSVSANVPEASVTGIDLLVDETNGTVNVTVSFTILNNDTEQTATIAVPLPTG